MMFLRKKKKKKKKKKMCQNVPLVQFSSQLERKGKFNTVEQVKQA